MTLIIVEAVPGGIKPPAADDSMRTSTSGKQGFGASAPSLTRASPMQFSGAKRDSTVLPKQAEEISPCFIRSAAALYGCQCSCLLLRLPPWRDFAAELDAPGLLNADCHSRLPNKFVQPSVEMAYHPIEVLVHSIEPLSLMLQAF